MNRGPGGSGRELARFRDALSSGDPAVRAAAVLRAPNVPGVEDLIVAALDDPAPDVRRAAVQTIGRLGGARGVRALMEVCRRDLVAAVRAEAVAVLGRIVRGRGEGRGSAGGAGAAG
jgi:HEAT repeat protein